MTRTPPRSHRQTGRSRGRHRKEPALTRPYHAVRASFRAWPRPVMALRSKFVGVLVLVGALAVPAAPYASRLAVAESGRPATHADDPSAYPNVGPAPALTGSHACSGHPGFTCSTLAVPLDH